MGGRPRADDQATSLEIDEITHERTTSMLYRYTPNNAEIRMTTTVVAHTSRRVGQVTLPSSARTSIKNARARPIQPVTCSGDSLTLSNIATFDTGLCASSLVWQARR